MQQIIVKRLNEQPLDSHFETLLSTLTQQATAGKSGWYQIKLNGLAGYEQIKQQSDPFKIDLILYLLERIEDYDQHIRAKIRSYPNPYTTQRSVYYALLGLLMRSSIAYQEEDYIRILDGFQQADRGGDTHGFLKYPVTLTLGHLQKWTTKSSLSTRLADYLARFKQKAETPLSGYAYYNRNSNDKLKVKIEEILAYYNTGKATPVKPVYLDQHDELGKLVNGYVAEREPAEQVGLYRLVAHCKKASGAKPSGRYLKEAQELIGQDNSGKWVDCLKGWLCFLYKLQPVLKTQTFTYTSANQTYSYDHTSYVYVQEINLPFVKGLIWSLLPVADMEILNLLAAFAEKCYGKIPGRGPLAAGVGNACLYVLAGAGLPGVSHLSRLKLKIRQSTTQGLIEKYISETSKALGVSPAEVEDMAVPEFRLTAGEAVYTFEGYRATLCITGIGKTEVQWAKADGTPLKGEPAALKKSHGAALKEIKNTAAQVQKTLTAQRDRLDRAFIADRRWSYDRFSVYYLYHGLMGYLTRQLIWTFTRDDRRADAFWLDGAWQDAQGNAVDWVGEGTQVQVWHPIGKPVEEVLAWREFLTSHQVRQPLKQAYREVYLLTDAEVNTRTYSNRMAAHVLRQHQFNALAKGRGWKYSLLGCYDGGSYHQAAEMNLPDYDLQAEFWVNEVNADHAYNDTGIWHYVSTDQVRFCRPGAQAPLPLTPPLVLSEVMRDVDLFVGVASVGNDPQWRDNGGLPAYRDYWQSYSFGELSEVAKTRKAVLERLVPRLRIGKQCRVQDKFLVVQGTLRTYKIHLGSGNILMEPNDQYLCIVPDRRPTGASENVFLPFEGDAVLSIILSKAFLLAADDQITDPTITRQLR